VLKKITICLSNIILIVTFLLLISSILIYTVPWYSIDGPLRVNSKCYYPGQDVKMLVERNALINLRGHTVKELIRIGHDGVYHKVTESSFWSDLERGERTIELSYLLPGQCRSQQQPPDCINYEENTYKWVGHVMYRPFGLVERYVHFESENFQIRLEKGSFIPSFFTG